MMDGLAVIVKGVLAGVPWGLATALYAWLRRKDLVSAIREEGRLESLSNREVLIVSLANFGLMPPMAGILAALAYSRMHSPSQFFWLALAATVFVSIVTLFRRIPHKEDRIISYFIAGPGLGWLVPRLFAWLSW
ncbi:MAG: hypothetical protein ACE5LG_06695 [Anaerolineae bacterium]